MNPQDQIQERITFLEKQLDSLDHYLPETYQYLIRQLDLYYRDMMELRLQELYNDQEHEQQNQKPDSGDQTKDQEFHHRHQ